MSNGIKNRKPRRVVTDAEALRATKVMRELAKSLGEGWPWLGASDRNRRAKLPKKGHDAIREILAVQRKYASRAFEDGLAEQVEAMNDLGKRMRALGNTAAFLKKVIDDVAMQAESEAWSDATAMYTTLVALARRNAALATSLQPTRAFFKARRNRDPEKKRALTLARERAVLERARAREAKARRD